MSDAPSAELLSLVEDLPARSVDKLDEIRAKVARVRDLRLLVTEWERQVKEANKEIQTLTFEELPALFEAGGVRNLGLDASGNLPAYDAAIKPYYKAVIAAEWEPARQDAAFALLQRRDAGDLIKSVITVELARGELGLAEDIAAALRKIGVPYSMNLSVHWGTLTSWLREQYAKKVEFTPGELETIGARVATVVEVKPRRE